MITFIIVIVCQSCMGNKPIFHGITFRALQFFRNEVKGCSSQHSLISWKIPYIFFPSEALLRMGRVHISNNIRFHDKSQMILESMWLGSLHFLPSILSSVLSFRHHQRHIFFRHQLQVVQMIQHQKMRYLEEVHPAWDFPGGYHCWLFAIGWWWV